MQRRNALRRTGLPRVLVACLAGLLPLAAWAACTCGYGDGRFTLLTIDVDGNMSDWAPVHADLDNNVCDGPANGTADRDAPVQSTGRDLTHFAFTYDANNIYLFTERSGSVSNTQSFVYYADTDFDGLMEMDEPVIGVTWRGSNRRVSVYLFTYVPESPGGDPMVDANNFGDGYALPGTFANMPSTGNPNRSGTWGSSSGQQMEFLVTWAELGLTPGEPFTFHVASSNVSLGAGNFAAQIDDNLAGCGGGPGLVVQTGLTFTPDRSLDGIIGQTAVGVHTLTNLASGNDLFDFSTLISGDYSPTVSYYVDTDASGTLTAADLQLTDTDGDSLIDTGLVAPGAALTVLIAYDIPPATVEGEVATVSSTATSNLQALASAAVTDTITAVEGPAIVVSKSATVLSDPVNLGTNPLAIPGSIVEYSVTLTNQGPGTADADSVSVVDAIPVQGCLIVTDINGPGSGPVDFIDGNPGSELQYVFVSLGDVLDNLAFSSDGGLSYNYTPAANALGCDPAVTHVEVRPGGEFAADLGSGSPTATIRFRVRIN